MNVWDQSLCRLRLKQLFRWNQLLHPLHLIDAVLAFMMSLQTEHVHFGRGLDSMPAINKIFGTAWPFIVKKKLKTEVVVY